MGRKRKRDQDLTQEEEASPPLTLKRKRVKKVKKKRHLEKQVPVEDEEAPISITDDESQQPLPLSAASAHRPLTLKIKLGSNEILTTTEDRVSVGTGQSISNYGDEWVGGSDDISPGDGRDISFQFSGQEEEIEDDEEAWLVALETGTVNERGYLPQAKDPTAMTARQRSMLGSKEEELLELPLMKMKSDEIESEEMLLKKTERNKKRRLQAIKRREKHKADTVQKLLQKQSTKKKDEDKKMAPQVLGPHIRYYDHVSKGTSLSVTPGLKFPIHCPMSSPVTPPARPLCSVCSSNPKKYSDSKTNQPLCSLQCYRRLHNTVLQVH